MTVMLQSRVDEFSYQVFTSSDTRFWFRLEREKDRDIVTDYFIGSFPAEQGGMLLIECYKVLGLTPRKILIFKDILSGQDVTDPRTVETMISLYSAMGQALMTQHGIKGITEKTEEVRGKCNLTLTGKTSWLG